MSLGYSLLPWQFTTNICNICDMKCRMCPNHAPKLTLTEPWGWYQSWWRSQPDMMKYDDFEKFIKRLGLWRFFIRNLSLTGRGETLLHPDLLKFCELLNRYKIRFTITTNGNFLTNELEQELSKFEHLDYVRVSLFNPRKYEHWVQRIQDSPTKIKLQNVTGKHIEGLEDGYISTTNAGTAKYSTMPTGFVEEKHCIAPFSFNTLNTDGSLVTCIAFREVGNVFTDSWWSVWNGKKMRAHRKQALDMNIPPHLAFCRDCGYFMHQSRHKEEYWAMNKLDSV